MSGNYVVMAIEGVLVESQDLHTGLPSQSGHMLYDALVQHYSVVLVTHHEPVLVDTWLRKEGIRAFATVLNYSTSSTAMSLSAWKARQVREFTRNGTAVAWYIDTDPGAIAEVYMEGVPTLLMSNPYFTRPEFRPDAERKVRAWGDLVTTIETEQLLRVSKEAT
jgi:hypothetical protein